MRKKIILGSALVIFLGLVWWFYNSSSSIEITIDNPQSGSVAYYTIYNQANHKALEAQNSANYLKERVPRATYEIRIQQSGQTYFGLVKTQGFRRTTRVVAQLQQQKGRKFVGNNPGSCMNYINHTVISYSCGDFYSGLGIHMPATSSQATYVQPNNKTYIAGYTEGIIQTSEGNLALIRVPGGDETLGGHTLYTIDANLNATSSTDLAVLKPGTTYSITPYREGFMIYSTALTNAYYYSSTHAKPSSIDLNQPKTSGLTPVGLSVSGTSIARLYSSNITTQPDQGQSEVVVSNDGQAGNFVLPKAYTSALLCGDPKMLCVVGKSGLDVYDINGSRAKLTFSVNGVSAIENSSNGFLAADTTGILNLDISNRSGFYEYVFGDYKFNGIAPAAGGYLLNLVNNRSGVIALYLDQKSNDSESIDKKIETLQKQPEVSFVSIYGNYIYIAANLGPLVYSSSGHGYIYAPGSQKQAADRINAEIDKLNIDRSVYKISSNAF